MPNTRMSYGSVNDDKLKTAQHSGKWGPPEARHQDAGVTPETQALLTETRSLRADIRRQLWVVAAVVIGANVTLIKLLP